MPHLVTDVHRLPTKSKKVKKIPSRTYYRGINSDTKITVAVLDESAGDGTDRWEYAAIPVGFYYNTTNMKSTISTDHPTRQSMTATIIDPKKERTILMKKDIFRGSTYRGYALALSNENYSAKQLDREIDLVETATERHSKVLVVRMDLRYAKEIQSSGDNNDYRRFLNSMMKELSRKHYDPQYVAKREQTKSKNPHLHLAVLVDGNKKRDRNSLVETAEKHWANTLGITPDEVRDKQLVFKCNRDACGDPRPNGDMLRRGSIDFQETKDNVIKMLSYLAKRKDGDMTESSTRKVFFSQFRKDSDMAFEKRRRWIENHRRQENNEAEQPGY